MIKRDTEKDKEKKILRKRQKEEREKLYRLITYLFKKKVLRERNMLRSRCKSSAKHFCKRILKENVTVTCL